MLALPLVHVYQRIGQILDVLPILQAEPRRTHGRLIVARKSRSGGQGLAGVLQELHASPYRDLVIEELLKRYGRNVRGLPLRNFHVLSQKRPDLFAVLEAHGLTPQMPLEAALDLLYFDLLFIPRPHTSNDSLLFFLDGQDLFKVLLSQARNLRALGFLGLRHGVLSLGLGRLHGGLVGVRGGLLHGGKLDLQVLILFVGLNPQDFCRCLPARAGRLAVQKLIQDVNFGVNQAFGIGQLQHFSLD